MRRSLALMLLFLGTALAGCAEGRPFAEVAPGLAPPAADAARIFLYRDAGDYEDLAWVRVFLNGGTIGAVGPGQVILRDVAAPGIYTIAPGGQGLWPDQAKTVRVQPGETVYAKIEAIKGLDPVADAPELLFTYVIVLQDPQVARREIQGLRFMAAMRKGPAAAG